MTVSRIDALEALGIAWTAPRLLLTRADDMLRLGVAWRDAQALPPAAPGLPARLQGGNDARLILIFPPQAVAEAGRSQGRDPAPARLAGRGELACKLAPGAVIELSTEGILAALAGGVVVSTASLASLETLLEAPAGLLVTPWSRADDGSTQAVAAPGAAQDSRSPDGAVGLWQARMAASSGTLELRALGHLPDDEALGGLLSLSADDRARIVLDQGSGGIEASVALSALGTTLTAQLHAPTFGWNQRIALGRDQSVVATTSGILYPFGHRALSVETSRRMVGDDGVAALEVDKRIVVIEPVRRATGFDFRFSEVEIVLRDVANHAFEYPDPATEGRRELPQLAQMLSDRQQALVDAKATADDAAASLRLLAANAPRTVSQLAQRTDLPGSDDAQQLLALQASQPDVNAAKRAVDAANKRLTFLLTHPPKRRPPGEDGNQEDTEAEDAWNEACSEANAALTDAQATLAQAISDSQTYGPQLAQMQQQVAADLADFPEAMPGYAEEAARQQQALDAIAQAGSDIGQITALQAALAAVLVWFVPRDAAGNVIAWPLQLTSQAGDVHVQAPLIFVADIEAPGEEFAPAFDSLTDSKIAQALDACWRVLQSDYLPVDGTAVDLVQAAASLPGDVHEVHGLAIAGKSDGARGFRPSLESIRARLPSLRALLPDRDDIVDLAYAVGADLLHDLPLVPKLPIDLDFIGHAARSGGLLVPKFSVDALSRTFGLVSRAALPDIGLPDLSAIYRETKLLGLALGDLIKVFADDLSHVPYAPKITPIIDGGRPVGARMQWSQLPLQDAGIFRTGAGGSKLDLDVKTTADSNDTTCTVTNFSLHLPAADPLVTLNFAKLAMTQFTDKAPHVDIDGFGFTLDGALKLFETLQEKVLAFLPQHGVVVRQTANGVSGTYAFSLPDVTAGAFQLRGIAVSIVVDVPFTKDAVTVSIGFASAEQPFTVGVLIFGGGGYFLIRVGASGVNRVELSIDFGAFMAIDLGVASGEVHAYGALRLVGDGDGCNLQAGIRIGGSVQVLGLVAVSIELALTLTYEADSNRLAGRASLVIQIDVLFLSRSVELDTGLWVISGPSQGTAGGAPARLAAAAPAADEAAVRRDWETYWGAYA